MSPQDWIANFRTQGENEEIQSDQRDLYSDADAVKDAEIFDENLPATQQDTSDEHSEKETPEINYRTESTPFSDLYAPERRTQGTAITCDAALGKLRQASTKTQHPPMEIEEDYDKRVP